ncbi:MAG: alpha-1,2-fucosyltransferase [Armatimonadota bacterium]
MIIVRLKGGLGNQLFQYAIGRRIALSNDAQLKLDISTYRLGCSRPYRLGYFNINAEIASEDEMKGFLGVTQRGLLGRVRRVVRRHIRSRAPYHKRPLVEEKSPCFDPDVLQVSDNSYLDGYWQTEKYFQDIEQTLREDFELEHAPDDTNRMMLERVNDVTSVSLHIRRGDYLSPHTYEVHGVCSLEYYESAVRELASEVQQPHFFVFSDDPEWVKRNLRLDYPTVYVDHNGEAGDYEDLRLMSSCKHHIIANSTFSWWGAWLCANLDKIIIAPRKWFNSSAIDTRDLIPASWRRI